MNELVITLIIVCPLVFLAAFIDAVAGGGGLISLPAYLLAGLPAHMAMGTNKLVASTGTVIAAVEYLRKGKLMVKIAVFSAVGAAIGGGLGSKMALIIPEDKLTLLIVVALPIVAVFLITQKNLGSDESVPFEMSFFKQTLFALSIGIFIGFYDGLVGPGTGTFMIIAFAKLFNMDLVTCSGCAKLSNLASNVASAIIFMIAGEVMWIIVIPAAACSMIGGIMGAKYAIKGGSKNVRKLIFVVIGLLFIKFIIELI